MEIHENLFPRKFLALRYESDCSYQVGSRIGRRLIINKPLSPRPANSFKMSLEQNIVTWCCYYLQTLYSETFSLASQTAFSRFILCPHKIKREKAVWLARLVSFGAQTHYCQVVFRFKFDYFARSPCQTVLKEWQPVPIIQLCTNTLNINLRHHLDETRRLHLLRIHPYSVSWYFVL